MLTKDDLMRAAIACDQLGAGTLAERLREAADKCVCVPREPAEKLQAHLTGMLVASCNCDTKPPDVEYHEIWCRYRQTSEAVELIDAMLAAAPGAAK